MTKQFERICCFRSLGQLSGCFCSSYMTLYYFIIAPKAHLHRCQIAHYVGILAVLYIATVFLIRSKEEIYTDPARKSELGASVNRCGLLAASIRLLDTWETITDANGQLRRLSRCSQVCFSSGRSKFLVRESIPAQGPATSKTMKNHETSKILSFHFLIRG